VLWQEKPRREQAEAVLAFIRLLRKTFPRKVKDEDDIVELRGSLIGYSLIGHHENPAKKKALDPDAVERKRMLAQFPDEIEKLHNVGIDVSPAGTTTIEFFLAGRNKGFNIERLIEHERWKKEECIYIGDELEPGRNDESVIGVIPTHAVKDPEETFDFIRNELLSS
ncbi:MAG: HAD hydrolase family protein, partial [Patescibacteria group bacterium]|nr:HAD hydrolase family protein [Patescibacteria group bacterium]